MLSALEAAFGPGETVRVYSEQRNDVIARLVAGDDHVQPWLKSAAYDTSIGRDLRIAHKRGYFWIAREYEARMGVALPAAPIWVGFNREKFLRSHRSDARRITSEKILVLDVPRCEMLLSDYDGWSKYILAGVCLENESEFISTLTGRTCTCIGRQRRETWQGIFQISEDPKSWQGIVPRFQASWLVDVIE